VKVDGARVNIPSYTLGKGQVVSLSDKARNMIVIQHNIDTLGRAAAAWLDSQDGGKAVAVRDVPSRDQIDVPVKEQLIVELYSK
jgi:small subunit ribosomal protein S4